MSGHLNSLWWKASKLTCAIYCQVFKFNCCRKLLRCEALRDEEALFNHVNNSWKKVLSYILYVLSLWVVPTCKRWAAKRWRTLCPLLMEDPTSVLIILLLITFMQGLVSNPSYPPLMLTNLKPSSHVITWFYMNYKREQPDQIRHAFLACPGW